MGLTDIHASFAWVVIAGNTAAAGWALAADRLPRARGRALWWLTAFAQGAIVIQVALGVTVQSRDQVEPGRLHSFYGFIALLSVGLIYSYRTQLPPEKVHLLYGLGGAFITGLCIRALVL